MSSIYDIKQLDGEATVILELWESQSNPSLLLLQGSLWFTMVTTDTGQRELFDI